MIISTTRTYAPRTRGGLLISCVGFAVLAASLIVPGLADLLGPVMGIGFVLAVAVIASVPKLVRPGRTWFRATLPARAATAALVGPGVVALVAVTAEMSRRTPVWGWTAAALISVIAVVVALADPEGAPRSRSRR